MGFKKESERRRAENQVVFREHNERTKRQVEHILPTENRPLLTVGFTCECSDEACAERIPLTVIQFKRLVKGAWRFVIRPGHEQSDIERVVESGGNFVVVEKFEDPPATNGLLKRTSANSLGA